MSECYIKESLVEENLRKIIVDLVSFPNATVCKHFAALKVLATVDALGFHISDELASAIIGAEDETALSMLKRPMRTKRKENRDV